MDNEELIKILNDIKQTADAMIENIENKECVRFFSGKLSLLVKAIFSATNSIN